MKISELLKQAETKLEKSSTPRLDALVLLEYASGKPRSWLLSRKNEDVNGSLHETDIAEYKKLIRRRAQGEPLAYITGVKEFYGLELAVSPDVLVPRPESETLVDFAIEIAPENSRLIDVGTGSGALAIAIARARPDLQINAADISEPALKMAAANAQTHGVEIDFILGDLLGDTQDKHETAVANLPYVSENFKQTGRDGLAYEPPVALYGGGDGLKLYRHLFNQLGSRKKAKFLIIEADPRQHEELIMLARKHDWQFEQRQDFGLALSR